MGAGLDVTRPNGNMVVDVGGGITELTTEWATEMTTAPGSEGEYTGQAENGKDRGREYETTTTTTTVRPGSGGSGGGGGGGGGDKEKSKTDLSAEKEAAASNLLKLLIISGIAIEIAVVIVSYYLADLAIHPVREAYESQKIFIANASHEIKTPLAAIAANLEAADIRGNKWIRNVERETEKLTTLNGKLLTLARTDLVRERKTEPTDVAKVLNDVAESYTPRFKNRTFTKNIMLTRNFEINREDFVQLMNILFDNAVKYSDKKIILDAHDNIISVSNDGKKISPEALPHIFERFYQTDKTADGVGLGLAIAKSLADGNGWKLTVKSGDLTTFILQV